MEVKLLSIATDGTRNMTGEASSAARKIERDAKERDAKLVSFVYRVLHINSITRSGSTLMNVRVVARKISISA